MKNKCMFCGCCGDEFCKEKTLKAHMLNHTETEPLPCVIYLIREIDRLDLQTYIRLKGQRQSLEEKDTQGPHSEEVSEAHNDEKLQIKVETCKDNNDQRIDETEETVHTGRYSVGVGTTRLSLNVFGKTTTTRLSEDEEGETTTRLSENVVEETTTRLSEDVVGETTTRLSEDVVGETTTRLFEDAVGETTTILTKDVVGETTTRLSEDAVGETTTKLSACAVGETTTRFSEFVIEATDSFCKDDTPDSEKTREVISDEKTELLLNLDLEKSYECPVCHNVFSNRTYLAEHMETHTYQRQHTCITCGAFFKNSTSLRRHISKKCTGKTKDKEYKCEFCNKILQGRSHYQEHLLTHCNRPSFICKYCSKAFFSCKARRSHVKLCHKEQVPFKCDVCGMNYSSLRYKKQHMVVHQKKDGTINCKMYACKVCGKQYIKEKLLEIHSTIHAVFPDSEAGQQQFCASDSGPQQAENMSHQHTEDTESAVAVSSIVMPSSNLGISESPPNQHMVPDITTNENASNRMTSDSTSQFLNYLIQNTQKIPQSSLVQNVEVQSNIPADKPVSVLDTGAVNHESYTDHMYIIQDQQRNSMEAQMSKTIPWML